ncbi:glycosyltransferase involved in cell wall biosynthesis [Clostridium acetobutylicum]|uniref:Predicted glycosyltransferase n=1 Tax=Clostridium acetobutylicum (strain ATCC 824 / DSM 792 / JCM 1419 / IAM 19013 / LMG 5710 / NBRC 13948 / NRRL B-527 / VKM B-1787 / 2291 / W) TaxID=272562 RepID=Q97GG2_CLOAB|nr:MULTISPECIES: glycosyltransferase family 4 protein [Clostridium]AAK80360.1 Predicted glycosyltransferase [Clostridium acetobutylicum ATCC 824]ADZ21457.1 glycosyltransferase [Clostridium acetobutylicum EA 2018]AEI33834.1 glycosyltransferase [Clostridium acetobutylicum DSM 1731]AWV79220.1 glycosyltransferase family 1 protein [Clostridium acetobutylicum]MBC2394814.1 glycosyltransferase family 4 protein [Clostridium acetobutylicum]
MKDNKINILFLSWRDIKCPKSGGAEVFTHEMLKRLDFNKYDITHFSPTFEGAKEKEIIDNVTYIRRGNILSVISEAKKYYKTNKDEIDFVVDQCNTHKFFTPLWVPKKKRIFFIHQLTREIWHINARFPISTLGYLFETPTLRLYKNDYTITVSDSTKKDLIDIGFDRDKVTIFPEGINFKPWDKDSLLKEKDNIFGYIGRFVNYKGIDAAVKAYCILKKDYPNSKLWIIGKKKDDYIEKVLLPILKENNITYGNRGQNRDITFWGFVSEKEKLSLMSKMKALLFPSIREGFGLTVIEAGAVGTPTVVYNSKGLVDAVDKGKAGYLCEENTPENLYYFMKNILENENEYGLKRKNAHDFSLKFNWDSTSKYFDDFINKLNEKSLKK